MSSADRHAAAPPLAAVEKRITAAAEKGFSRAALAFAAAAAWLALAALTLRWPDVGEWGRGLELAIAASVIGLCLAALAFAEFGVFGPAATARAAPLRRLTPWLCALGIAFSIWELLAAKTGVLPQPFFPPPQAILEVFTDDYAKLAGSVLASVKLELLGFAFGASAGFLIGVWLGWSRRFGYWVHPVLRLIGPLPATAWLPIAFFAFPSSWSASIFLIGLTTGFPVAVLTSSGVSSVNTAYYDVARTLGAGRWFLVWRVAVPAALPHVFVGLFMGLSASFAVLVTAEMMGVKAGLGFYLQWAQSWASYANMYAALLVMSAMCAGLITLLFKIRARLMSYQKAEVEW